ncbi:MAG: glycosyltransferase [Deltaproteobacteria bacterium]|nr:glycosyltransferase [Deltaproteobacteria bacterium]
MLAWLIVCVSFAFSLAGLVGLLQIRTRRRRPGSLPPITVLKPLSGADDDLEQNLETFLTQSYPRFEILFGVTRKDDPAISVVRRLLERHPRVSARLIVHEGCPLPNPKVANLAGLLPHAQFDALLISDSNVAAPSNYLADLAAAFAEPNVGLVTNLFRGVGERTLGAALENATLNGFIAVGNAAPTLIDDPVVVGKSMLFRRSTLDRIGGLAAFGNVLAEDYLLARAIHHAGQRIAFGSVVLSNVNRTTKLSTYWARHLRWSQIRSRVRPPAFALEPLTSPLVAAVLTAATAGLGPALVVGLVLATIRDMIPWIIVRGLDHVLVPIVTWPIREACLLAIWLVTPFIKTVSWRGHPARIGPGSFLFVPRGLAEPSLPVELRPASSRTASNDPTTSVA